MPSPKSYRRFLSPVPGSDQFVFERPAPPLGQIAFYQDGGRAGRITDIVFEMETGDVMAYEFVDDAGSARYLPARDLREQSASRLRFAESARGTPGGLADFGGDPDEFCIMEVFDEVE